MPSARLPAPLSLSSSRVLSYSHPRPRVPITSRASVRFLPLARFSSAPSFLIPRLSIRFTVVFSFRSFRRAFSLFLFFPSFSFSRRFTFLLYFFRTYLFLPLPSSTSRTSGSLDHDAVFSSPNIRLQFSSFAPFLLYPHPTDFLAYWFP